MTDSGTHSWFVSAMKQRELNLMPRKGHRSSAKAWRYRFANDILVEELGSARYVYGLWDRRFGCWQANIPT